MGAVAIDGFHPLAKVGVAGSNTDLRSQGWRQKSPDRSDTTGSSDFSGSVVRRSQHDEKRAGGVSQHPLFSSHRPAHLIPAGPWPVGAAPWMHHFA